MHGEDFFSHSVSTCNSRGAKLRRVVGASALLVDQLANRLLFGPEALLYGQQPGYIKAVERSGWRGRPAHVSHGALPDVGRSEQDLVRCMPRSGSEHP